MTYILLIVILFILGVTSYLFFDKDILSPSVISCFMFLFCAILALLGTFTWNNVSNISSDTIIIIFIGVMSFILGELVARCYGQESKIKGTKKIKIIKIETWKYVVTLIGIAITIILFILEIKRICAYYGFFSNNLSKLLAFYRTKTSLFSTDLITDGTDVHFIIRQMRKVCDVVCIIFMYIVANNIVAKDKPKRILMYSVPIFLTLFVTLLNSGRSIMMHMLVGFLMMFLIIFKYKNKKISKKMYFYLSSALFCSLLLFYLIAPLLGRGSDSDFFNYITFYLGAPIPSFNHFLTHMPVHSNFWGFETFSNLYATLTRLNIVDALQIGSREWINFNGFNSNVYMSFRRYFFDFGIIGVIICQFIFGFVSSKMYLNVKKLNHPILLLIYGYYSYMLVDQIRDEQFFGIFGSTAISYLLLFYLCYFIYFKYQYGSLKAKVKINTRGGGKIFK